MVVADNVHHVSCTRRKLWYLHGAQQLSDVLLGSRSTLVGQLGLPPWTVLSDTAPMHQFKAFKNVLERAFGVRVRLIPYLFLAVFWLTVKTLNKLSCSLYIGTECVNSWIGP